MYTTSFNSAPTISYWNSKVVKVSVRVTNEEHYEEHLCNIIKPIINENTDDFCYNCREAIMRYRESHCQQEWDTKQDKGKYCGMAQKVPVKLKWWLTVKKIMPIALATINFCLSDDRQLVSQ